MVNVIEMENYSDSDYNSSNNNFKRSNYNIEDMILVRLMGEGDFPFNKCVQSPKNGNVFAFSEPYLGYSGFNSYARSLGMDINTLNECLKIPFKEFRNSTYWCINGSVPTEISNGGNFSGRPFIVFDKLSNHINDSGLETVLPQDSKYNGDMQLSDESVLAIDKKYYDSIKNDSRYLEHLEKFRTIYIYSGEQEKAVATILEEHFMVDSFSVGERGYIISNEAERDALELKMTSAIKENVMFSSILKVAEEYDIDTYTDDMVRSIDMEYQDQIHSFVEFSYLRFLAMQPEVNEKTREKIVSVINKYENKLVSRKSNLLSLDEIKYIDSGFDFQGHVQENKQNGYLDEFDFELEDAVFDYDEEYPSDILQFQNEEFDLAVAEMASQLTFPKIKKVSDEFSKEQLQKFVIDNGRDITYLNKKSDINELNEMFKDEDVISEHSIANKI